MALVKCEECGNEVSSKAKACPKCGAKVKAKSHLGSLLLLLVLVIILSNVITDNDRKSSSSNPSSTSSKSSTYRYTAPEIPLEIKSWSCGSEYDFMHVKGEVKNTTSRSLRNVMVVATYRTASGEFIKSSDALIDYNPILPGQTSPFKTLTTKNPAFKKCNIAFKYLGGGTIQATTRNTKARSQNFETQTLLNSRGYDVGKPDGIMGPKTREAIRAFQRDNGMTVDGKVSSTLLTSLKKYKKGDGGIKY